MKKILIGIGIFVLLLIALGMLFLIGREIQPFIEKNEEVVITPSKLSDIKPIEKFNPTELKQDETGRVLSVPENINTVSPPEDRTFVY